MPCLVMDSSVLASLSGAGALEGLRDLFCPIFVPEGVRFEIVEKGSEWEEAEFAQQAIIEGHWLLTRRCRNRKKVEQLKNRLDLGESEVIALAIEIGCLAAIDEKKGRKLAIQAGLRPIGSLGLLLLMKKAGIIPMVKTGIDLMLANGFRCSPDLISKILREADE